MYSIISSVLQFPFNNIKITVKLKLYSSVLNRSPEHLIKEIILVDDFSDNRKFIHITQIISPFD